MTASINNQGDRQAGFSMVEALVALVVLSVGMLGIASLYVVSLRSSGSAISRTQAVNLASDLADRIRANRSAGEAYEAVVSTSDEAAAVDTCIGQAVTCDPATMAAYDLSVWRQQITATMPGGTTGTVAVDGAASPRTYTITIEWTESREETLSYSLRMQI